MDEEPKKPDEEQTEPSEPEDKEEETTSPVEDAKAILNNINKANEELRKLVERGEKIKAEDMLAGKSEAGTVAPILTEKEKVKEQVNVFLKGTGLNI